VLIDTHAHLSDPSFDGDRDAVLARALEAGVAAVLNVADSPDDWERVLALCRRGPPPPRLLCALGLHPYYADRDADAAAEALLRSAGLPGVAAVGEIGLDYAKCPIPPDVQKRSFLRLLEAAGAACLPVIIHSRDAFPDTLDILDSFYRGRPQSGRFRGVLHCFSGGAAEAARGVALGFALGVDGPVTYPKNEPLRAALRAAGLDRLVLETDCPYLPPQSSRGKRNEPAAVREIAAALAAALGVTTEEAAGRTSANALALFGPKLGA
jgi:TatD DNase family protein